MDFDLDKSRNMEGLEAFLSKNKEFKILKAKYSGNFIQDLTMFLQGWQRAQVVECPLHKPGDWDADSQHLLNRWVQHVLVTLALGRQRPMGS